MPDSRRALWAIFVSTFASLCGFFMLLPLLVLRLSERGLEPWLVGAYTALMWLGIFLITPWAGGIVARLGRRQAFILSSALPFVAALGFLTTDILAFWALFFLLDGMASGVRWVLGEATIAELAPPDKRGRIVGLFETMVGLTFVVGPLLLQVTGTEGQAGFVVAAGLAALGLALTLMLPTLPPMASEHNTHTGLKGTWRAMAAAPAVMIAGFVGGFFESGLTGLLPLLGLALGWSAALATALVASSGLGSAVAMVPVGEAADRLGLRPVSIACAAVTLLGSLLLPWAAQTPGLAWAIAFIWGGAGGALYTLAMIDIGHRLSGIALINTTGVLIMAYTAGGIIAPVAGGWAMQFDERWGLAGLLAGVATLGLIALVSHRRETH